MDNADMPAVPTPTGNIWDDKENQVVLALGLTKREHFAGLAMQGIISKGHHCTDTVVADEALRYADALLKALGETDE